MNRCMKKWAGKTNLPFGADTPTQIFLKGLIFDRIEKVGFDILSVAK